MHGARILGYVLVLVLLQDGERVHIGADGDDFAAFPDLCDHAGLADAAPHTVPHLLQLICHDLRCAVKLEADLGMHVKITPPFDELLRNCMCLFEHGSPR
jgi:hypothetical protein